ncbi:MAG TPA: adenosylhomocysteinase [Thermoanaerobaculia bacterium]|nr:adenosylhomocysteinase [Thermoanaerobaculia bacterium]
MRPESTICDISLAPEGERKIQWVAQHAHTLNSFAAERLSDGSLRGRRIAIAVHLEAKTAYLAWLFHEAGAEVAATGSNPFSTQDDVCAALVRRGVTVHAIHGADPKSFDEHLLATLDFEPDLIVDDGAELVTRLHQQRRDLLPAVRGASEETTSGVVRLRAMEQEGALEIPVIVANEARCKQLFDNRYGTGQSALTAILSATNLLLAGKTVVVAGYGWVGQGLALYCRGFGARVVVVETDPFKGLEAASNGFEVSTMIDAAPIGDLFVTGTGSIGVLRGEHFERMKDCALLANAGNFAHEIDVPALAAMAVEDRDARRHVTEYVLPDGRRIHLLAQGALVNIAASDGHPVEIMDLSFSVQMLSIHHLARHGRELAPGVHALPAEVDDAIARRRLELLGMKLEEPTPDQVAYARSWR